MITQNKNIYLLLNWKKINVIKREEIEPKNYNICILMPRIVEIIHFEL